MKRIFYLGLIGLALFEVMNVYFIMPMPGSQRMNSLDFAYFLYSYRWYIRIFFGLLVIYSARATFQNTKRKWIPIIAMLPVLGIIYLFNFVMIADHMFEQPKVLTFKSQKENVLSDSSMVVAVENNGQVKAYPIQFIVYHHQVRDVVGGKPMMITYCSVCRTGRVFEPKVKGELENFRLVGMDHFNAMFEDATTKSWWRQATGEAVTGKLKGEALPEVESFQIRVDKLFEQYPHALVMQPDEVSKINYDSSRRFETGKSRSKLTGTDSLSWKDKSWVVGIDIGGESKAYDWNLLKAKHIINDKIGVKKLVLVLSADEQSFIAFENPFDAAEFTVRNDTLFAGEATYDFSGHDFSRAANQLKIVKSYQEFWHSWRTFHPQTKRYE